MIPTFLWSAMLASVLVACQGVPPSDVKSIPTAEMPTEKRSQGLDLIKLHHSLAPRKNDEQNKSSTTTTTSTAASAEKAGAATSEGSLVGISGKDETREFLSGRFEPSFDPGESDIFDPSVSGGFGNLGIPFNDLRQRSPSGPLKSHQSPFLSGESAFRPGLQGGFINANAIDFELKTERSRRRPGLTNGFQHTNNHPDRPGPQRKTPARAVSVAAGSVDELPRPFPIDGVRGGNTGFRLASRPSLEGAPASESSQDHRLFFQPSASVPAATTKPAKDSETVPDGKTGNPAVTNKGLPLQLPADLGPINLGDVVEDQERGFGGHRPSGFLGPYDQNPGYQSEADPFTDPATAARYRLLQRFILEDRLRTQGAGASGLTRRPGHGPDYYSQLDSFGYPQQDPSLEPPVGPGVPGPGGPIPPQGPGLRPELAHGYPELDERFAPRCAQLYDDVYGHYNRSYCLYDPDYPTIEIVQAVKRSPRTTYKLFSDVTYQSADDLVDGLAKDQEEGYTYEHYFGQRQAPHFTHQGSPHYRYNTDYYRNGGYICPSDSTYARPKRAQNVRGLWKVIVNLADEQHVPYEFRRFTQTQRLEHCLYPDAPCSYIGSHYNSRCLQKHNYARLVAFNRRDGLHMDSFRLPVACSCHVGSLRPGIGAFSANAKSIAGDDASHKRQN